MNTWTDSLGIKHNVHEPLLLKGGPAAFTADPHQGAFRALVDDMIALRERRRRVAAKVKVKVNTRDRPAERQAERIARADHLPAIRPTTARPVAKTTTEKPLLRKSLADLARETERMALETQRQTAELQRQAAITMFDDLHAAAKAGKLGAIEAAKLDALAHHHARELGMETTGVRA